MHVIHEVLLVLLLVVLPVLFYQFYQYRQSYAADVAGTVCVPADRPCAGGCDHSLQPRIEERFREPVRWDLPRHFHGDAASLRGADSIIHGLAVICWEFQSIQVILLRVCAHRLSRRHHVVLSLRERPPNAHSCERYLVSKFSSQPRVRAYVLDLCTCVHCGANGCAC